MIFSGLIPRFIQHVLCGLLLRFSPRMSMDLGTWWARRDTAVVGTSHAELLRTLASPDNFLPKPSKAKTQLLLVPSVWQARELNLKWKRFTFPGSRDMCVCMDVHVCVHAYEELNLLYVLDLEAHSLIPPTTL